MSRRHVLAAACLCSVALLGAAAPSAAADRDHAHKDEGPAALDRTQARQHARRYADRFAALRQGTGPAAQQQRAERRAAEQRVATIQPHFAATHPWVQRPIAQAGYYVPTPDPVFLHFRFTVLHRRIIFPRRPIFIPRRPIIIPRRPWRRW